MKLGQYLRLTCLYVLVSILMPATAFSVGDSCAELLFDVETTTTSEVSVEAETTQPESTPNQEVAEADSRNEETGVTLTDPVVPENVDGQTLTIPTALDLAMNESEVDSLIGVVSREINEPRSFVERIWSRDEVQIQNAKEFRQHLFHQREMLEEKIRQHLVHFGFDVSQSVREMRDRRILFQAIMLEGDGYKGAEFYEKTFLTYNVAISQIIKYSMDRSGGRDQELQTQVTRPVLLGLAQGSEFSDIRAKINESFSGDRTPETGELINFLDLIVSRVANEVRFVEWYLNKLESESEDTEVGEAVAYMRRRLSPADLRTRYDLPILDETLLRSIDLSQNLDAARPQIVFYWLRRVLRVQQMHSARLYVRSLVHWEKVKSWIGTAPTVFRAPLMFLLKLDYNTYVVQQYIDSLEAVTLNSHNIQVLLNEMGALDTISKKRGDQFLETLARLAPNMRNWNELLRSVRQAANEDGSNSNFAILERRMVEAEAKAEELGFLSTSAKTTAHSHIVGWVIPLGAAGATYLNWDSVSSWFVSLAQFLPFVGN